MAVEVASAYVTLMPSMKGFKGRMERETRKMGDVGGGSAGAQFSSGFIGRTTQTIGKWAKRGLIATGVAVGAGLGTAIAGGINRMLNIEDAENKLVGLGHSSETVSKIMENALAAVKGTAFGLDTAATQAATAVAAGVKPGQELVRYLTLTGDAATIAGVGLDEMGSIFGKVQTNQRAFTQELNQLADRGIPIYQWLQEEYGVTAVELRKMVSAGQVDAETYFKVIEDNIGGAALSAGDTTRGALANMRAAWSRFGAVLVDGIFPLFKDGIVWFTGFADSLAERVGPAVEWVGDLLKPLGEGLEGVYKVLTGQGTGQLAAWLGVDQGHYILDFLRGVRTFVTEDIPNGIAWMSDLVSGLFNLFTMQGTGLLASTLGVSQDHWIISFMQDLRDVIKGAFDYINDTAIPGIQTFFEEFRNGEGTGGRFRDALVDMRDALSDIGEYIYRDVLPRLRDLGAWMLEHKGLVLGVMGAYVLLRGVMVAHTAAMAVMKAGGLLAWLGKWVAQLKIVRAAKAAWAAITWVVQGAMKALNLVMRMNPIGLLVTAIMVAVGAFIYLWNTNEDFRAFFIDAWNSIKDALVGIWNDYIMPVFRAIWSWITDTLVPAFVSFYQDVIVPVWDGIWGAIKAAWDFIYPIFAEIADFIFSVLVVYFQLLSRVAEIVWKAIWTAITHAWENWIRPVFQAIWNWIKDTLIPWFEMLWDKVSDVWSWISDKITGIWRDYVEPVFSAIWNWIKDTLIPWFTNLWHGIRDAFDWIGDKINTVWERWISPAFDAMERGVNAVRDTFDRAVDAIGRAWDRVKQVVAKPIVAVLEFVNDGIIGGINRILNWAGVSPINTISVPASLKSAAAGYTDYTAAQRTYGQNYGPGLGGYADGGVLPGYSPGYDNMKFVGPNGSLKLSGGEAIMRPEWTRAVGPEFVNSMNAIAKSGGISGVRTALGFADGGIMPTGDGTGYEPGLWDFLKDGAGFLKRLFTRPLEALRGNPLYDFASGAVSKLVSGVKDKILSLFGFGSEGEAKFVGTGMPWQAIWGIVKGLFPDAILTSAVRNSTVAGYGGKSLHASGRAIDFVLNPWSRMVGATKMLSQLMGWTELIHTPAGMWQQSFGRPFANFLPITKSQHYNHVHAAMKDGGIMPTLYDTGGWLQPGVSLVANHTGKPEAVFTDEQLGRLGGDTHVTLYGIPMDTAAQTADEVLYQMRRVSRGKYASRR